MNRLYVIQYGTQEIRGLVSPGELPEVVRDFYRVCEQKGAVADYKGEGHFIAVKEKAQVTLTIGAYHQSMPSKMLVDALMEVIEKAF